MLLKCQALCIPPLLRGKGKWGWEVFTSWDAGLQPSASNWGVQSHTLSNFVPSPTSCMVASLVLQCWAKRCECIKTWTLTGASFTGVHLQGAQQAPTFFSLWRNHVHSPAFVLTGDYSDRLNRRATNRACLIRGERKANARQQCLLLPLGVPWSLVHAVPYACRQCSAPCAVLISAWRRSNKIPDFNS